MGQEQQRFIEVRDAYIMSSASRNQVVKKPRMPHKVMETQDLVTPSISVRVSEAIWDEQAGNRPQS